MKQADRDTARQVIRLLLDGRKATTIKSVYQRLAPNEHGIICTVQSPGATDTGRLNSSETFLDPSTNIQNIPKKIAGLHPLYNVRDVLRARPGQILGEADLSQAEARVAAVMSRDPLAMQQYADGVDRYKYLAAAAFHGDPDRMDLVTKAQRQTGKMGQLAFQFQVGWRTFMEQVNMDSDLTGVTITASAAKRLEWSFLQLYKGYPLWWKRVEHELNTKGYLVNPFGRKRYFFGRNDTDGARSELLRRAVAFLPQSTIADLMNWRIRVIWETLDPELVRILLQVHDAIIFECDPERQLEAAQAVKDALEVTIDIDGIPLLVPAEVSLSEGAWSAVKEIHLPHAASTARNAKCTLGEDEPSPKVHMRIPERLSQIGERASMIAAAVLAWAGIAFIIASYVVELSWPF